MEAGGLGAVALDEQGLRDAREQQQHARTRFALLGDQLARRDARTAP